MHHLHLAYLLLYSPPPPRSSRTLIIFFICTLVYLRYFPVHEAGLLNIYIFYHDDPLLSTLRFNS